MSHDLPHQLIIFGPPGTSKSYKARYEKTPMLGIRPDEVIPVTFHAEFGYGDFVSRLLPLSEGNKVHYQVHAGPFIRALALALHRSEHGTADSPPRNVVLLIDEINRGNCAEIFGDIFQLLDRDDDGQSSYSICASKLTVQALINEIRELEARDDRDSSTLIGRIEDERMLRLPANLYLIGTMNTGDESIFFMDSAFKRRWNFQFSPAEFNAVPAAQANATIEGHPSVTWKMLVDALNAMIVEKCTSPNLDDKLIGPWFIKARAIAATTPPATLEQTHAASIAELRKLAPGAAEYMQGADYSQRFDDAFCKLRKSCNAETLKAIDTLSGFDESAKRKLKTIAFAISGSSPYYKSKINFQKTKDGMLIEDFVEALAVTQEVHPIAHHIAASDIEGKLFLYLWDNVFERDKSPLAEWLRIPPESLRTFGQFSARRDDFIRSFTVSEDLHAAA